MYEEKMNIGSLFLSANNLHNSAPVFTAVRPAGEQSGLTPPEGARLSRLTHRLQSF